MIEKTAGIKNGEITLIKTVARLTPWFAPFPSAYFVARSSIVHLELPLVVAIIIAVIVEFLGLTSVHTWLWLSDWNNRKRKVDPSAPSGYAMVLCLVYLVTSIMLTIMLEIFSSLSTYAPALFPALALVGALNLAMITQQDTREARVYQDREERRSERSGDRSGSKVVNDQVNVQHALTDWTGNKRSVNNLNTRKSARVSSREIALKDLIVFYTQNPNASYSAAGRAVNRSKAWISEAVVELERRGELRRSGNGIEVIGKFQDNLLK